MELYQRCVGLIEAIRISDPLAAEHFRRRLSEIAEAAFNAATQQVSKTDWAATLEEFRKTLVGWAPGWTGDAVVDPVLGSGAIIRAAIASR